MLSKRATKVHAIIPAMHAVECDVDMAEGRTIQVRGVDPVVAAALERAAKERGMSLSAYIREWLGDLTTRQIAFDDWWANRPPVASRALTQEDLDAVKSERESRLDWR